MLRGSSRRKIIPIEKLVSLRNPAELNDTFKERVKVMMEYIAKDGRVEPLEVCQSGNVYIVGDGHHRYEALKRLGWKEIPCIIT